MGLRFGSAEDLGEFGFRGHFGGRDEAWFDRMGGLHLAALA